jgi:excisionase family DNA binding protein
MPKFALSVREACEAISVSKTKLYALIGKGQIQALRIDGKTVITTEEINRFLSSLQVVTTPTRLRAASQGHGS